MAVEPWMSADRAEQEITGSRGVGKTVSRIIKPTQIDQAALAERIRQRNGAPYVPGETPRPYELTHDQWNAAQGYEATAEGDPLGGFMADWAEGGGQDGAKAGPTGRVMVPNIDSTAPDYRRRLMSADAARAEPQGMIGKVFGETFRLLPKGGQPETMVAEYYTYTGISTSDESADAQLYELPKGIQQQFADTAYAMGRYRGEKSATGLYQDMLALSRERAAQGEFFAPEEIMYELINQGVLPMGEVKEGDDSGGGGGGGGGGYGGGGGGGATVNLTTPQQARFYVEQAYKTLLGRIPTAEEIDKFVAVLREAELNNPVSVEMVDGVAAQTGGYDPQILAAQMAKAEEEYQTRGANQYYNMFMDLLAGG